MAASPPGAGTGVVHRHHALIAGTGRAGTSFLVSFLEACGLDTGDAPWFERARAGGEHAVDPGDPTLPYVLKDPALGHYCDQLDLTEVTIDVLIAPVRDLSLNVVDQERLLAVGFHRLVRWATIHDLPLILLDFPRLVEDCDYLLASLSHWLDQHCDGATARAAFAATARAGEIRVREMDGREARARTLDRMALVERIDELTRALDEARSGNAESARAADPAPASGRRGGGAWLAEDLYAVAGTEFTVTADAARYLEDESTASRLVVAKTRAMVDRLAETIDELAPKRIFELGIYKGGSTALLASLARPTRLTALDLAVEPVQALEQHIAAHGLTDVIRTHYGVDKGNVETLSALAVQDHGAERLDLVVDDASHLYRETRSSFEVLFARLRPGGLYVIEDWAWAHFPEPLWQERGGFFHDRPALTNLVVELMMIAGTGEDLVARINVLRDTVTVTRGPLELDGPLRLEGHYANRGLGFRPLI